MSLAQRQRPQILLTVLLAFLSFNAFAEVVMRLLGRLGDPGVLTVLQAIIGTTGALAAYGSWTAARWSPIATLVYGLVTTGMLLSLGPMLDLDAEAVRGIRLGALSVVLFSLSAAWYLRRLVREKETGMPGTLPWRRQGADQRRES